MRVEAPGITVDVPAGWEVEIDDGAGEVPDGAENVRTPRVHLANFALPPVRGDFGSGAVERMVDGDALVCLLEESARAVGSALYRGPSGVPRLSADDFSPAAMQRPRRGQSGTQVFFHADSRAFVLYVVLGSHASRHELVTDINRVLAGIALG